MAHFVTDLFMTGEIAGTLLGWIALGMSVALVHGSAHNAVVHREAAEADAAASLRGAVDGTVAFAGRSSAAEHEPIGPDLLHLQALVVASRCARMLSALGQAECGE